MTTASEAVAELAHLVAQAEKGAIAENRAVAALQAYEYGRSTVQPAIAATRRRAVRELRALGYSLKECAELLDVTDSRISQITSS